jgi:hypothetical protein
MDLYLQKRDPVRKAKRILSKTIVKRNLQSNLPSSRKVSRRSKLPATIRNQVFDRDAGQCTI